VLSIELTDAQEDKSTSRRDQEAVPVLGPVGSGERIDAVDVLRGVALLGILAINIDFFALPSAIFFDPRVAGGFDGINRFVWDFNSTVFLQKMMGIFSMLFGAGLVLMDERAQQSGRPLGSVYYRRIMWLLLFGLLHGYLLWHGDILFSYAVCGLFLYPLRRRSPRFLITLGTAVLLFGILLQVGSGASFATLRKEVGEARRAVAAGEEETARQRELHAVWENMVGIFQPSAEDIQEEIQAYRGGYMEGLRYRVPETLMMQTQALLFMTLWRAAGLMLIGMALMKLGVFSAIRSTGFYLTCIAVGYGIGLPLCLIGARSLAAHNFDFVYSFFIGNHFNYVGSVLVALAHTGVVMLVCKSGALLWLTRRLGAVGRMALSNYVLHSLICTTVFLGYGLGLFARVDRGILPLFVIAIWVLQLAVSPWWLSRFRFGPAEWLWRTLTYARRQPMRIR
jgi:uncharacterized protein